MKKSTIWLLAVVMTIAFFGLLYMQITHFETLLKMRSKQFDEVIDRSLYQVSKNLELDQTRKFLDEGFRKKQKTEMGYGTEIVYSNKPIAAINRSPMEVSSNSLSLNVDDVSFDLDGDEPIEPIFKSPNRKAPNTISRTLVHMHEDQKKRYLYERENLNDVVTDLLNTASSVSIEKRINFRSLANEIRSEIRQNGIELPFQYEIVNSSGKVIYRQDRFSEDDAKGLQPFQKVLFPNDPADKLNYLNVYFPTKDDYLFSEMSSLLPTIMFTFILLITFIIIIYLVFRQKRLSEMKNDFMNNMTHELKTPVSTISLAAQMLKDGSIIKSPDVFKHISGVINDETERLSFQVEKVLQMSLFEREKATLKLKEHDANDIVVHVANTFQIKVENFGGELDIDLQATESTVNVDKMHFTNVLFNLLDNAVKYRREEEPLKLMIRTWNSGSKLYISVEDNGIGMKKDYTRKIFDRFYRVSTGNRHDVKGFGLGLAYVKKIIEDHKGSIKADSEYNRGTKFIMNIPIVKARPN